MRGGGGAKRNAHYYHNHPHVFIIRQNVIWRMFRFAKIEILEGFGRFYFVRRVPNDYYGWPGMNSERYAFAKNRPTRIEPATSRCELGGITSRPNGIVANFEALFRGSGSCVIGIPNVSNSGPRPPTKYLGFRVSENRLPVATLGYNPHNRFG